MEGGLFILVLVAIVLAPVAGGLYAITLWLRGKQLDPEGDKVEGERDQPARPEHLAVENEQRTRLIGTR